MGIRIIKITEKPLTLMGECAAVCWDSNPSAAIAKACIDSGHHRVMEYPEVIFEADGYSSRLMREVFTHCVG